jgi:hypothetical protein
MTVNISPAGGVAAQFFTDDGIPLAGGKLYSYAAGTSTPQTTYTDSTGATARSNPIILNSAGRVGDGGEIWLTGNLSYKFILKDSTDVLIATYDNVSGIAGSTELLAFEALLAGSTGASLVGYLPASGPVTTVQAALIALQAQDVNLTALASINGGQIAGLRNRIINGAMAVDQRNAAASQTITAGAALAYTVDRFYAYSTGANVTGQQVAGTSPNAYLYRFTGAASVTKIGFAQRIENINCQDLAEKTATLSVDLSNSLLTTVTWAAYYANTANTFGSLASPTRTLISTGTFTVTSTLTRYNTNITVPLAATTGIEIELSVAAQVSGTWSIGNCQLELGSVATTFEQRSYGLELMLCQRYYETGLYASGLVGSGTTNAAGQVGFFVPMRVSPTVTQGGTYTVTNGATSYGQSSASFTSTANPYKTAVNLANYTGLTSAAPYITDSGSNGFNASAEL